MLTEGNNMDHKKEALLKHDNVLSDELKERINRYFDYEASNKAKITIVSGEERLKAKSSAEFEQNTEYCIEGYSPSDMVTEIENFLISDYIVIHTAAIKMAPLALKELLLHAKSLNKKAFVIIDKWNMLPITGENLRKVKNEAVKDFSMVNLAGIYNVGNSKKDGMLTMQEIVQQISLIIEKDFLEVRKTQVDKLFRYYLKEVQDEYREVKRNAGREIDELDLLGSHVKKFHRSNTIKIKCSSSEWAMYSRELYNKWKLINVEECIGETDYEREQDLKNHVQNEYVQQIVKDCQEVSGNIKFVYQKHIESVREKVLNEMYGIKNQMGNLHYLREEDIDRIDEKIHNLKSIDEILQDIELQIEDKTDKMEKRVKNVARTVFDEETIENKLKRKLQEFIDRMKSENNQDKNLDDQAYEDENLEEPINEAEASENITLEAESFENDISEDDLRIQVGTQVVIRKYYKDVIEKCNIKLYSDVDEYINVLKKDIDKKTVNILDMYYLDIEKCFDEIEMNIKKDYIVI